MNVHYGKIDPPNEKEEHYVIPSNDLTNSERVGFLNTLVYLREQCDPTKEQQDAILLLQKMYADNLMFL